MRTKFYLRMAPAEMSQLVLDHIFGRISSDNFNAILLQKKRFKKETAALAKMVKDQDWSTRRYRMQKEYKQVLDHVNKTFYPKVSFWTRLLHYQKYSKMNKLGGLHIAIMERKLIVKYFDMQLV